MFWTALIIWVSWVIGGPFYLPKTLLPICPTFLNPLTCLIIILCWYRVKGHLASWSYRSKILWLCNTTLFFINKYIWTSKLGLSAERLWYIRQMLHNKSLNIWNRGSSLLRMTSWQFYGTLALVLFFLYQINLRFAPWQQQNGAILWPYANAVSTIITLFLIII